jgi:hypothetical protein
MLLRPVSADQGYEHRAQPSQPRSSAIRSASAQAGHLDLARPVAGVKQRVQRAVGVSRLDPHQVTPDLEVHQRRQSQQECLIELAEQPKAGAGSPAAPVAR